jgi:type IV pilus assembly protein PilQ
MAVIAATSLNAQSPPGDAERPETRRMSATWRAAPVGEVLRAFAAFSGASIVAGAGVSGFVNADINNQPWDVALASILSTQGLFATENAHGIIRVENMASADSREVIEPIVTRSYRISFSRAAEIEAVIAPLLSPRGGLSVLESTNTMIVSDIERVQRAVAALLR